MHRSLSLFLGVSSACFAMVDHVSILSRLDARASSTFESAPKSLFSRLMFDAIFSDNETQLSDVIFTMIEQIGIERSLQLMKTMHEDISHEPSLHNHAYERLANHIAMFSVQHKGRQQTAVNNTNKNKPVVRAASVAVHAVARVMQKKAAKPTSVRTARLHGSIHKKKAAPKRQHNTKRHVIRRNSSKNVRRKPLSKSKPVKHVIPQQQPRIIPQTKLVPQQKQNYVPSVPSIQIARNLAQQQRTQLHTVSAQPVQQVVGVVQRPDRSLQEANRYFVVSPVAQKQEKRPAMQEQRLPASALPQIHAPLDKERIPVVPPALSVSHSPELPTAIAAKLVVAEQEVRPAVQQKVAPVLPQQYTPLLKERVEDAKPELSIGHELETSVAETVKSVELKQEKRPVAQQREAPALPPRDALLKSTHTQEDEAVPPTLSESDAPRASIVTAEESEKRPVVQQRGAPALPARNASLASTCAQSDEVAVEHSVQDQMSPQVVGPSVVAPVCSSTSRVERMLSCARSVFSDDESEESDERSDSEWDAEPLDAIAYDRAEILTRRVSSPIPEISVEQQQHNRAQEAAQAELLREQLLARNKVMQADDYDSDVDAFSD